MPQPTDRRIVDYKVLRSGPNGELALYLVRTEEEILVPESVDSDLVRFPQATRTKALGRGENEKRVTERKTLVLTEERMYQSLFASQLAT